MTSSSSSVLEPEPEQNARLLIARWLELGYLTVCCLLLVQILIESMQHEYALLPLLFILGMILGARSGLMTDVHRVTTLQREIILELGGKVYISQFSAAQKCFYADPDILKADQMRTTNWEARKVQTNYEEMLETLT